MKLEKLFKAITGAGTGALVAFLLAVTVLPDKTDVHAVLGMYLALMAVFALVFSTREWRFRTSALSYLAGLVGVSLVLVLSRHVDVGMGVILLVIALSLLVVLYPTPSGVADVLLAGPLYFSGAMTVLAVGGALNLFGSMLGTAMATVFIGFLGMIGVVTGAAARLLFAKPKP
ncbi:hypothetical protein [Thermococcus sp. AM4]|uniref:hypothetical protein n=1 Tax=Thermococcus sp. (strain AM4) TaxID=246969 RepID=UPI0011D269F1|nr:hypothetical protein [Thermococcus sp. AM4]